LVFLDVVPELISSVSPSIGSTALSTSVSFFFLLLRDDDVDAAASGRLVDVALTARELDAFTDLVRALTFVFATSFEDPVPGRAASDSCAASFEGNDVVLEDGLIDLRLAVTVATVGTDVTLPLGRSDFHIQSVDAEERSSSREINFK
jgi:hypothetical protein